MALLGHGHRSAEQQQEVREARRLLKERVRNDWDYPTLPAYRSTGRRRRKAGGDEVSKHDRDDGPGFEAVEWRERECSTETESDEESVRSTSSKGSTKSKKSQYKFDGPDSVGAQISNRRTARKRKRQTELEQEMGWNEGLAHWMLRRDAWCCAHTAAQVRELESGRREADDTTAGSSSTSTPRTSTSSTASPHLSSAATTPDPAPPQPLSSHPPTPPPSATAPQSQVLIPVSAPILPNHPIRRRISPSMYTEIYTKIILQSRTPSVPLNLLTLISAMVQGWKNDGEWPPKPAVLEPSIAGKRKQQARKESQSAGGGGESGFRHGVKAVGRVLRLTGTSEVGSQSQHRERGAG
ncbi:hypothetical protein LTR85_007672 [Meristemomyces frigidus]|nr:hypothetical protein LTR85_007672 [Meristemomyces frigidus]